MHIVKRLLLKRMVTALISILGAATLVFAILRAVPGDPAELILGEQALPADLQDFRHRHCLDQPLFTQYQCFWSDILSGDLGHSMSNEQMTVSQMIFENVPASAELAIAAMLFAVLIAWPLGFISAMKPNGAVDLVSTTFSIFGVAIPNFWLGNLLLLGFAATVQYMPETLRAMRLQDIVLPAITLGLALAAKQSRVLRSELVELAQEPFVTAARARGLSKIQTMLHHQLPVALIPVVTIIGLQMGAILVGTIVTEEVFARPGMGTLLLEAIRQRDFNVVQGCVLFIAFVYVIVNLLTDLLYMLLDPRVSYEN